MRYSFQGDALKINLDNKTIILIAIFGIINRKYKRLYRQGVYKFLAFKTNNKNNKKEV